MSTSRGNAAGSHCRLGQVVGNDVLIGEVVGKQKNRSGCW
jgi:hypothetical protein